MKHKIIIVCGLINIYIYTNILEILLVVIFASQEWISYIFFLCALLYFTLKPHSEYIKVLHFLKAIL